MQKRQLEQKISLQPSVFEKENGSLNMFIKALNVSIQTTFRFTITL